MLRILDITAPDINNGNGIRITLWVAGCTHKCKGCHNGWTWDYNQGIKFIENKDAILNKLSNWLQRDYVDGITFSGGDPMFQPKECAVLANYAKSIGLDVWCYTGFTFEELLDMAKKNKDIIDFLNNIDILVDGKFMIELKSYDVIFRGSTNQRIIDVKESLKSSSIVLAEKYIKENKSTNFRHQDNIYV